MWFFSVYQRFTIPLLAMLGILSVQAQVWAEPVVTLGHVKWIHGSPDCSKGIDPPIQVFQQDKSTWVLRQNTEHRKQRYCEPAVYRTRLHSSTHPSKLATITGRVSVSLKVCSAQLALRNFSL